MKFCNKKLKLYKNIKHILNNLEKPRIEYWSPLYCECSKDSITFPFILGSSPKETKGNILKLLCLDHFQSVSKYWWFFMINIFHPFTFLHLYHVQLYHWTRNHQAWTTKIASLISLQSSAVPLCSVFILFTMAEGSLETKVTVFHYLSLKPSRVSIALNRQAKCIKW